MNISKIARSGYLVAAMAFTPFVSMAGASRMCPPGQPTEESYTWDFPREASGLLRDIQAASMKVDDNVDQLRNSTTFEWQGHAVELMSIREKVNDMGTKLCRLETIRTALPRWQQQAIDRTAILVREMANNTELAVKYLNKNRGRLWAPTYRQYEDNLSHESRRLSRTIGNFETLAKLNKKQKHLHRALGVKATA